MLKFLFTACLLALLSIVSYGSITPAKPTVKKAVAKVLRIDSSKIQARNFNNNALQQYTKDKAFQYDENGKLQESFWERFWSWLWSVLARLFSFSVGSVSILPKLILAAFVALLVYVIFKVAGIDVLYAFKRKPQNIEIPYAESLENIHEINFDTEIEKAVEQRNYRLAVRLLYLRSLKQLSDAQLIHWQIEKTNSAYLNELTNDSQRQSFGLLTRQFEYIWYGDFFIDGSSFQNINTLFQDFKQLLR